MTQNKNTIVENLLPLLKEDAISYLQTKNIPPETYVLWVYTEFINKTKNAGYAITAILTLGLGWLTYIASGENPDAGDKPGLRILLVILFSGLGLLIGILALRRMEGKEFKNVEYSGFPILILGLQDRTNKKFLEAIPEKKWIEIKQFRPDPTRQIYKKIVGTSNRKPIKLTPSQERKITTIKNIRKIFGWATLPGLVLFPFTGDYSISTFLFAWFTFGVWLFLDSLQSFIEKKFEALTVADSITFYGWQAKFYSLVIMMVAILIFILPGLNGVIEAFGINLVELIF